MSTPEFKHFLLRHVDGVVVIEMLSKDIQGPDLAKEFITELMTVVELDDCKPIVLNLRRTIYFSSMGFSALFKLVKCAKERQRPVTVLQHAPGRARRRRYRGASPGRRDRRQPRNAPCKAFAPV